VIELRFRVKVDREGGWTALAVRLHTPEQTVSPIQYLIDEAINQWQSESLVLEAQGWRVSA
jgi:hypothetical protein